MESTVTSSFSAGNQLHRSEQYTPLSLPLPPSRVRPPTAKYSQLEPRMADTADDVHRRPFQNTNLEHSPLLIVFATANRDSSDARVWRRRVKRWSTPRSKDAAFQLTIIQTCWRVVKVMPSLSRRYISCRNNEKKTVIRRTALIDFRHSAGKITLLDIHSCFSTVLTSSALDKRCISISRRNTVANMRIM